ncbi:hypothetical protein ElyMa_004977900 [Elysia marginata]|uniref:Uncharacterized protein n=1 Tax=Elysia marginata TaxID=1093978 RepID=A0AAV4J5Q7_9GAST|nr:hypothetical protein ElyMa_004977900 [Elysia marginata]
MPYRIKKIQSLLTHSPSLLPATGTKEGKEACVSSTQSLPSPSHGFQGGKRPVLVAHSPSPLTATGSREERGLFSSTQLILYGRKEDQREARLKKPAITDWMWVEFIEISSQNTKHPSQANPRYSVVIEVVR